MVFELFLAFEPGYRRVQYKSGLQLNEEGGKMFPYAVEMEPDWASSWLKAPWKSAIPELKRK